MKKITEAIKRDWQLYLIIVFVAVVLSISIIGCMNSPLWLYGIGY